MIFFDFPAEVTRDHKARAAHMLGAYHNATVAMWLAGKETQLDRNADPLDPDLPRLAQHLANYERELVTVETKSAPTGAGDYEETCTGCAQLVNEAHSFRECLANIAVGRDLIEAHARAVDQENLTLQAELTELKEGYHALDRNWEAVHTGAMEAIRGALEMPDASVPEMVIRIREALDLDPLGPPPPPPKLFVFTDDNGTYVIARNKLDVGQVLKEEDLSDDHDEELWEFVLPTKTIPIKVFKDTGIIAPADEHGDHIQTRHQTAAEWIAIVGKRGLLCTSEY